MKSVLRKNIFRDIKNSRTRFISIMLIVALGVGFFTGVKATSPSMNETAERYYRDNNLMDYRLLSTVGFDDDDVEAVKRLDNVRAVEPSYFSDVMVNVGGAGSVFRLYSVPQKDENGITINNTIVKEGRLPEKKGEIAVESSNFGGKYKIGDVIEIDPKISGEDTTDSIEDLEYTVVGFVQSPMYVDFERGTTTVGSGSVSMYGFILPEEFVSERYTQLYVLTDYSDGSMKTLSEEYTKAIEDFKPQLESLADDRTENFVSDYLPDAKKELADAQEELDSEREKAEQEIADGEKEISDAEDTYNSEIADAQKQLEDAEQQIQSGEKALEDGQKAYDEGIAAAEEKLDSSSEEIKSGREQLAAGKKEFEAAVREGEKKLSAAEREYNKGLSEYNSALEEFKSQTAPARLAINLLQSKYDLSKNEYENIIKPASDKVIRDSQQKIDDANAQIADLQAELENASDAEKLVIEFQIGTQEEKISLNQKIIDSENQYLTEKEADVKANKEALDNAVNEYNEQTAEPQAQLDDAKAQLDDALEQINAGKAEIESQKILGQARLAEAEQQLNDGAALLTEGREELAKQKTDGKQKLKDSAEQLKQAKEDYEKGKQEFESKKQEGKEKLDAAKAEFSDKKEEGLNLIADAQSEIDKAKEKLDRLENPEWYIFTRTDNPGYESFIDDTNRVDAVATVFPLFFLLVAALVCLTTMTRHVEEKRTEIGTLKALGYSNASIKLKFIIYSASASVIGCILGITVGMFTLPYIIYNAYGIMYELQSLTLVMPWGVAIVGSVVGLLCTTAVSFYTCQKTLAEKPASLMRPKAPKLGRRIFLERIPFIWKRMNFTSKVTARNIMRYKARFLMTVIGVAGCTALILTGFGIKNSISAITDKQFGEIYSYDMLAILEDEGTAHQKKDVLNSVAENSLVDCAMLQRQSSIEVTNTNGKNKQDEIYLVVPQSIDDLKNYLSLHERRSGEEVKLCDNSVVITEKMANNLGVSAGDEIVIIDDYKHYTVTVGGVSENYIYGYVYMSPDYYNQIYGKAVRYNMIMAKMTEDTHENEDKLGTVCLDNSDIVAVSFISGSIENFNDTVKSLDTVTLVLIFSAGLLAIVVLYNLTNINIAERVREIATIKVLGFYNGETCAFVYRENIVLTLFGIFAGLGLGVILHRFVILTIEINKTMFCREIAFTSFLAAAALTAVFAALVNFVMYFKIKKIDMVESLKSVE